MAVDTGDQPVGFLIASELDGQLFIEEVDVHPDSQRQGHGAALIAAARDHGLGQGFPAVTLTTYRDVPWNGPYYARLGFVEVEAGERYPGHAAQLAREASHGHDPARRCMMMLKLS